MKKKFRFFIAPLLSLLIFLSACARQTDTIPASGTSPAKLVNVGRTAAASQPLVTSVSRINQLANGDVEYSFNERQAGFTVSKSNTAFDRVLGIATQALEGNKPVKLIYSGHNTLEELVWPTTAETARYLEWYRGNIINPEVKRKINKPELESDYFNWADWQDWKVFKLCTKTVPSFAVAKTIFNYCAAQGCYLGPTQVSPCIPFEYVRDGCFARAHKMRWIIESNFKYCSEKVFSYGNLDVKADKWGGCCVGWVYHVAPLIRVSQGAGLKQLCYVIDPGMFNEPVLLSVWLAAQGNTTCDGQSTGPTAYSIQPSSAYTPAGGYNSQTYTTDPTYSTTNADLTYYNAQGNTCNN
jgi:Glutaminase